MSATEHGRAGSHEWQRPSHSLGAMRETVPCAVVHIVYWAIKRCCSRVCVHRTYPRQHYAESADYAPPPLRSPVEGDPSSSFLALALGAGA